MLFTPYIFVLVLSPQIPVPTVVLRQTTAAWTVGRSHPCTKPCQAGHLAPQEVEKWDFGL